MREFPDDLVQPWRLVLRQRLRAAHLERDLVRKPVGSEVDYECYDQKDECGARAAYKGADQYEQPRKRSEQNRRPDARPPSRLSSLVHVSNRGSEGIRAYPSGCHAVYEYRP